MLYNHKRFSNTRFLSAEETRRLRWVYFYQTLTYQRQEEPCVIYQFRTPQQVHVFTFRNEDIFLAWEYGSDPYAEYEQFYRARIDGFFTDFSASLRNYLASVKQNYSFVQHLSSYLYAK